MASLIISLVTTPGTRLRPLRLRQPFCTNATSHPACLRRISAMVRWIFFCTLVMAPQGQFAHLFAALHDALTDLERRTLPAAEEDAPEADLARPRINREKAGGCGGVRRSASPGLDDVSTIA
jgi:hypothetical protein